MSDTPKDPIRLDEELAAFTDRLLGGEDMAAQNDQYRDAEALDALKQTARRLHHFTQKDEPDPRKIEQIRRGILVRQQQAPRASWLQRLGLGHETYRSSRQQQRLVLSAVLALVLIAAVASLLLTAPGGVSLPATAGSQKVALGWLVAFLLVMAGIAVWVNHRRNKR